MTSPTADLDAGDVLAALETTVLRRRAAEVEDLQLCLHWADLHATDPRDDSRPGPRPPGSDRLTDLGGEGTPRVRELSLCELAVARGVHTLSARSALADALDLRHRLPRSWAVVRDLRAEAWVARKVASLTRHLARDVVGLVDDAVAAVIASESPARVLDLAAAKIVEADLAAHDARLEAERHRRFVSLTRSDDTGLRTLVARLDTGDALWVDATVTRVAEILTARGEADDLTADEARAVALGWLARPAELLQLLAQEAAGAEQPAEEVVPSRATAFPAELLDALRSLDLTALRPRTTLYVHLHEAALAAGAAGVARVESLGPVALASLTELLARTQVTVKPVIDLREQVCSRSYEFPEALRERIHLRRPGDAFPHASTTTRRLDIDHAVPWRPGGPPGQTSDTTGQPLSRTPHRAKTHLGWTSTPASTGEVVWRTPHGLTRLVDPAGTHLIDPLQALDWTSDDPLDRTLTRLVHRLRTGQLEHRPDRGAGAVLSS